MKPWKKLITKLSGQAAQFNHGWTLYVSSQELEQILACASDFADAQAKISALAIERAPALPGGRFFEDAVLGGTPRNPELYYNFGAFSQLGVCLTPRWSEAWYRPHSSATSAYLRVSPRGWKWFAFPTTRARDAARVAVALCQVEGIPLDMVEVPLIGHSVSPEWLTEFRQYVAMPNWGWRLAGPNNF